MRCSTHSTTDYSNGSSCGCYASRLRASLRGLRREPRTTKLRVPPAPAQEHARGQSEAMAELGIGTGVSVLPGVSPHASSVKQASARVAPGWAPSVPSWTGPVHALVALAAIRVLP